VRGHCREVGLTAVDHESGTAMGCFVRVATGWLAGAQLDGAFTSPRP